MRISGLLFLFGASLLALCGCSSSKGEGFDTLTFEPVDGGYAVSGIALGHEGMESVQVPSTYRGKPVVAIGDKAFVNCPSLSTISIPNGVTKIGAGAFKGLSLLSKVSLPDTLLSVGNDAFYGCNALQETTQGSFAYLGNAKNPYLYLNRTLDGADEPSDIAENCRVIGPYVFTRYGSALKSVRLPDSLLSICDGAFSTTALSSVTLPSTLKWVGQSAFFATNLTSIEIPASLCHIAPMAFPTPSLTSIQVDARNPVYDSRDNCNAIIEKKTDTLILGCLGSSLPSSIKAIGDYAFRECAGLSRLSWPEGLLSIGDFAFVNCGSLADAYLPLTVTSIGDYAFYRSAITSLRLGDALTHVGRLAFAMTPSLYRRTEGSLTYLGNADNHYVLLEGSSSTRITDLSISPSCRVIADYALESFALPETLTLPDSIIAIGKGAFNSCTGIKAISLPSALTSIPSEAFSHTALSSVSFPASLASIGDNAFNHCGYLTSLHIPASLTHISNSAFRDCYSLSSVSVAKENPVYDSRDNCNAIIEKETNTLVVGSSSTAIPSSVTAIGPIAFDGRARLRSITLPEGLRAIGAGAFNGCSALTSINIPSGVEEIGGSAFSQCAQLKNLALPSSLRYLGSSAFSLCSALTAMRIPSGTQFVGETCFNYCQNLQELHIPSSVTHVGANVLLSVNNATVYCQADSQPKGWSPKWNSHSLPVVWGYRG